jgi:hypothetical protein
MERCPGHTPTLAEEKMRTRLEQGQLARAAERLWSEGRSNPVHWVVRTSFGQFNTADRRTWHTDDLVWAAELRRSRRGQHVYLALFQRGVYLGRYDASGWHDAAARRRARQLKLRSLPLPLAA